MTLFRPASALLLAAFALSPVSAWAGSRIAVADAVADAALLDALTPAARAGGDDFGRLRDELGDG